MDMPRTLTAILASTTLLATAVPVGAADTEVQFTVEASSSALSVAVADPGVPVTVDDSGINPVVDALSGASIIDTLPQVTVTDQRGQSFAAWILEVQGEDFVNGDGDVLGAANARVYNDALDVDTLTDALTGVLTGMTLSGGEFTGGGANLGSKYTLLAGNAGLLGNGSVSITPTIAITIPSSTQAGTYSGTVTYTAS